MKALRSRFHPCGMWPFLVIALASGQAGFAGVVTNTTDNGSAGSLRSVITAAPNGDTITFAPSVTGTITLTAGQLVIDKDVVIIGPGANSLTISGNNASRVLEVTLGSNNFVPQVTITGVTFSNGRLVGTNGYDSPTVGGAGFTGIEADGGGIYNLGRLTLNSCVIANNAAIGGNGGKGGPASDSTPGGPGGNGGGAFGGGIFTTTQTVLNDCVLSHNQAVAGQGGAGSAGGNGGAAEGGGVFDRVDATTGTSLTSCTFDSNLAQGGAGGSGGAGAAGGNGGSAEAGGFYSNTTASYIQQRCAFVNNAASAGAGGAGGNATVGTGMNGGNGGSGGGASGGAMICGSDVQDCTFVGNVASHGDGGPGGSGGDNIGGPVDGNGGFGGSAGDDEGGAIAAFSFLWPYLTNCTFSGNSAVGSHGGAGGVGGVRGVTGGNGPDSIGLGGGIASLGGGPSVPVLINTIAASNSAAIGPDISGAIDSQGHNLIASAPGGSGYSASDILNVNPLLGPLQNNGGPTMTMALLPGSPAIDAGDDTVYTGVILLQFDQRGYSRKSLRHVDIGAYELRPADRLDFNGDLYPDLVVQSSTAHQVAFWFTFGANITGGAYALSGPGPITLPTNWQVVATGDFNGDGTLDLVVDNSSTGQIAIWFTNGTSVISGAYATFGGGNIGVPPGWQIVGSGDFNGDGKPDLVLQNPTSHTIAVWTMDKTVVTSGAYISANGSPINFPPGWQVVGVGDFNNDGHPDLVLDNPSSGQIAVWIMTGSNVVSGVYVTNGGSPIVLPSGWLIAAIGDYNGDNKPDLVLENLNNRQLAFWYVSGTALSGSSYVLQGGNPIPLPAGWQVVGPR